MKNEKLRGCLCWFWNYNPKEKRVGILADIYDDGESPTIYYELNGGSFYNCEPASRDDFSFYNNNPLQTAKEKAAEKIIETIDVYFNEIKEEYKNDLPNYVVGMIKNHECQACLESFEVQNAVKKYMELM